MIVGPLLMLIASALGPSHEQSRTLAGPLPTIALGPSRFLAFVLLGLLALGFLVPAVLGVAYFLVTRQPRLALVGAGLLVTGILCSAVVQGIQLVQHQMVDESADREQMVALLERLEAGFGLRVVFVLFLLGLILGWLVLSVALLRHSAVPRAVPVLILASLVVNVAGWELLSRFVFLAGLGWLGIVVLTGRDDVWPPANAGGCSKSTPPLHRAAGGFDGPD